MMHLRRLASGSWPAAAALLLAAACSRSTAATTPQIHLVTAAGGGAIAYVEVTGLSRAELQALSRAAMKSDDWQRLLTVSVSSGGASNAPLAIAGTYTAGDGALRFTPMYPFDPGRKYDVTFDGAAMPGAAGARSRTTTTVALAPRLAAAPTLVTQVFPSGDVVPENQLRMYIHFSAPMGSRGGIDHVRLLDQQGREVENPFLPLDAEFWNGDHTRYTVFFDPGRQKRGILPNRQLGPSLVAGRTYTLEVDRNWTDGNGNALRETFTRRFRAGPPDLLPLDTTKWRVTPPAAGTRDPLSVTFPEPLDHGLLLRAVGVRRNGQPVVGQVRVEDHERRWTMTPSEVWPAGQYELIALSILEDLAGNRIGRAFEVNTFERVDRSSEPAVTSIPFTVVSAVH